MEERISHLDVELFNSFVTTDDSATEELLRGTIIAPHKKSLNYSHKMPLKRLKNDRADLSVARRRKSSLGIETQALSALSNSP